MNALSYMMEKPGGPSKTTCIKGFKSDHRQCNLAFHIYVHLHTSWFSPNQNCIGVLGGFSLTVWHPVWLPGFGCRGFAVVVVVWLSWTSRIWEDYLRRIVRKPDFCPFENKGADQLRRSDTNRAVQALKMTRGWRVRVAKTKALIIFAATAKLVCAFVFSRICKLFVFLRRSSDAG